MTEHVIVLFVLKIIPIIDKELHKNMSIQNIINLIIKILR